MLLVEIQQRKSFHNFDELFNYIINACRPALQNAATPIYRGMLDMRESHERSTLISSGKRHSMSDDEFHISRDFIRRYDMWTLNKFNKRFLSEGIFATGSKEVASSYGEVFLIIPIGDFDYIWSPTVKDQLLLDEQLEGKELSDEQTFNFLDQQNYTNSNLSEGLKTGHEIIINCKEYFHISEKTLRNWKSEYNSLEELWSDLKG